LVRILFENIENENYVLLNDDIKRYMKNLLDTKSSIHYDEGKMLALISINEKPAGQPP